MTKSTEREIGIWKLSNIFSSPFTWFYILAFIILDNNVHAIDIFCWC